MNSWWREGCAAVEQVGRRSSRVESSEGSCAQRKSVSTRWSLGLFLCLLPLTARMASAQSGLDNSVLQHCGMRFRIATHVTPPFVMFNPGNCSEQYCSPATFGTDGGLTYQFMNNDVLPLLKKMCKDNGKDERVEFDWYAPYTETTSGSSPVNMVCNQGFGSLDSSYRLTAAEPFCKSDTQYKGAAPIDSACKGAYGTGALACNSTGPDIAVGAISITRERLDMLSFSVPMIFVEQTVVKRDENIFVLSLASIMTILAPFSLDLWISILAEIGLIWIAILMVEAGYEHFHAIWADAEHKGALKNAHLEPGWSVFFDAWYWAAGSAFDPGGPGKAPESIGGKVMMIGHWIFVVIIAASYTGTIGPFLSDQSNFPIISGMGSIATGAFKVVVRGPQFADLANSTYRGKNSGGNAQSTTPRSSQFNLLQTYMEKTGGSTFDIVTTRRYDSRYPDDKTPLTYDKGSDPCLVPNANLGVYDIVMCGQFSADAMITDSPLAFYELNSRYNRTGECKLFTIGKRFDASSYGLGFPRTSPYRIGFDLAIQQLRGNAVVDKYKDLYQLSESQSKCHRSGDSNGGLVMTAPLLAGLFIIVGVFAVLSCGHGIVEWLLFLREERMLAKQKELEAERTPTEASGSESQSSVSSDGGNEDAPDVGLIATKIEDCFEVSMRIEGLVQKLGSKRKKMEAQQTIRAPSGVQYPQPSASSLKAEIVFADSSMGKSNGQ